MFHDSLSFRFDVYIFVWSHLEELGALLAVDDRHHDVDHC